MQEKTEGYVKLPNFFRGFLASLCKTATQEYHILRKILGADISLTYVY